MKRSARLFQFFAIHFASLLVMLSLTCVSLNAQDAAEKDTRPVKNMFESIWLIDNQTAIVPYTGTLEFDIQHRFATWQNGYDDFFGVYAPSNIRLGINYVPIDKLQVGFGFAKDNRLIDFHAKYAILQQGRVGGSPVNLTYLVNMAIDTREEGKTGFEETTDNFAYFHQLMVARKLTDGISLQASGNISYFNYVKPSTDGEGNYLGRADNMVVSASILGRAKLTSTTGLIANFDIPFVDDEFNDPQPNISFGLEMVSSSHAFQIFIGNYKWILPQYNHRFNQNSFGDNEILIGFNMTRLWNF